MKIKWKRSHCLYIVHRLCLSHWSYLFLKALILGQLIFCSICYLWSLHWRIYFSSWSCITACSDSSRTNLLWILSLVIRVFGPLAWQAYNSFQCWWRLWGGGGWWKLGWPPRGWGELYNLGKVNISWKDTNLWLQL